MSEDLKSCPFCGGKASWMVDTKSAFAMMVLKDDAVSNTVQCDECQNTTAEYAKKEDAIAAWNRRAPAEPENTGEQYIKTIYAVRGERRDVMLFECKKDAEDFRNKAFPSATQYAVVRERQVISRRAPAETKNLESTAHEIWAAAQLLPGEGIEDGVDRITGILAELGGAAEKKLLHAFVQGAKWWEHNCAGATMWQSDQELAWQIAEFRLAEGVLGIPIEDRLPAPPKEER